MARVLRPRRGSSASHAALVGDVGEITVDTTLNSIVVHDGVTAGGWDLKRDLLQELAIINPAVGKTGKTIKISGLGVKDGDTVDAIFDAIFTTVATGTRIVIDRDVTFSRTTGYTISADDFTLEWEGNGHINAPNISNSPSSYLFRVAGTQLPDLAWNPEHAIDAGEWYLPVLDTSAVQYDDLIGIYTNIFFNGTGVNGFELMYNQDWLRVRSTTTTDVRSTNAIWFSATAAQLTKLEHYRPVKRTRIINPRITGPKNGVAQSVTNGNGARAFLVRGVVDFKSIGGTIIGFPGYAYQIARYDNAWVDGLVIDSGETVRTSQAYYGVVHEGGRNGRVTNCVGRNIRRTADTGGGGGLLAVDTSHVNIRGEMCNGSAAGTHHGKNYSFSNITSVSSLGSGMVIRSKDNNGTMINSLNDNGQAIAFLEKSDDILTGCGITTISNIRCSGGYDTAGIRGASIRIDANGEYDLQGTFEDHTSVGVRVDACHINKLKIRGTVKGKLCTHNVSISGAITLENVDICDVVFDGSSATDIRIAGATTPTQPARAIKLENNRSSSECSMPIALNSPTYGDNGWFAGETVSVENNLSTRGSGSICLEVGNLLKWTTAPRVKNNVRMLNNRYSSFSRGANVKTCIGDYANVATLPTALTILDGDYFEVSNPSAAAYSAYECIFSGTVGVLVGVTANITAGSNIATLVGNESGLVNLGTIITIAGSGITVFRVSRISEDLTTATLSIASVNTVTNATVGYRPPTFKGKSLLEA